LNFAARTWRITNARRQSSFVRLCRRLPLEKFCGRSFGEDLRLSAKTLRFEA
jgi:hypothetical protein